MAVPDSNCDLHLLALVCGLHRVTFDALNQAMEQVRIENLGIVVMHRYGKGIEVEARHHVHRPQRQLDRIGDCLQGTEA